MKHGLKLTALALSLLFLAGALLACVPAPAAVNGSQSEEALAAE